MDPELSYASNQISPERPPQSFLNRVGGVFFSPGETFEEIGRAPKLVLPLIAFLLLTAVVATAFTIRIPMEKLTEQRLDQAVEAGKMTPEQAEQQKEQMRKIMPMIKVVTPFMVAIGWGLFALGVAGAAKLISMLMGVENNFASLFVVTIYTLLVTLAVSSILFLALIYIKPVDEIDLENPLGSNLAALLSFANVGDLPKFLKVLLSYVDVFYIWKIFLLSTGFAAVSKKLKFSVALTWTIALGLLVALGQASWAAVFS